MKITARIQGQNLGTSRLMMFKSGNKLTKRIVFLRPQRSLQLPQNGPQSNVTMGRIACKLSKLRENSLMRLDNKMRRKIKIILSFLTFRFHSDSVPCIAVWITTGILWQNNAHSRELRNINEISRKMNIDLPYKASWMGSAEKLMSDVSLTGASCLTLKKIKWLPTKQPVEKR
jgi:hypothetical protein